MTARKTGKMHSAPIPEPIISGESDVEPFATYFERWPIEYAHVPSGVVETWRHGSIVTGVTFSGGFRFSRSIGHTSSSR